MSTLEFFFPPDKCDCQLHTKNKPCANISEIKIEWDVTRGLERV